MIETTDPFIKELCQYIEDHSNGRFTFGAGVNDNLMLGELIRGREGVFVVQTPGLPPDGYTPIVTYDLSFWSVHTNSSIGYDNLDYIYQMFHQNINITTSNYMSYFSRALSQIEDMDRTGESKKMYRLSLEFIVRNVLIS